MDPRPSTAGGCADLLEATLQHISDGVVIVDRGGRFVFFNAAAERILGLGAVDASPESWSSVYGCYRSDQVTPYPSQELPLARALQGERVRDEIFVRNSRIPEGAWISVSGTPLVSPSGAPAGAAAVFRDVTERWRTEQAVQRLSQAVEKSADCIVITDADSRIEYVNPAFEATTGFTKEEALGRLAGILETGEGESPLPWGSAVPDAGWSGSLLHRRSSGEVFSAERSVTPVRDRAGQLTSFVSVMRDVTGLQKAHVREADMRLAHLVQERLYPSQPPVLQGLDIAGAAFPADVACGDYYDFIPVSRQRVCVVIGDVAGHGFGPALLMAETRAYLRSLLRSTTDLTRVMTRLNAFLCQDTQPQHFVTLMLVVLDPGRRSIVYASAGHVPGFLLGRSGATRHVLDSTSMPLGIFPDASFSSSREISLEEGELFLLLTDGATEAQNEAGDFLESEEIIRIVSNLRERSAGGIVTGLHDAIEAFVPPEPYPRPDDITAIVCKVGPGPGA